jgi:alpha-galactosidase/6-phospho-beta-glucosidase family protein
MSFKIAIVEAGSISSNHLLMQEVVGVLELNNTVFARTDISGQNAERVTSLCERDTNENRLTARILAITGRRAA